MKKFWIVCFFCFFYFGFVFADDKKSSIEKADEYFEKMDFSKALMLYKKELQNSNQRAYLYRKIANCYEQLGDKKRAFKNYNLAIESDKCYLMAYYEKALFLLNEMHDKKEALNVLKKAVNCGYRSKKEKDVLYNMYILMGYIELSSKKYAKAESHFTKALYYKLSPEAFILRGNVRFVLKKYRFAKIDYEKAVKILKEEDVDDDTILDIENRIKECLKFLGKKNEKKEE